MIKQYQRNWHREKFTLDQVMKILDVKWLTDFPHIRFDPEIDYQYRRIERCTHDGTSIFSVQLMSDALIPLFEGTTYYKPLGECPDGSVPIYTIGYIRRASVYGMVEIKGRRFPGMRESIIIPVRVEYVPTEELLKDPELVLKNT